MGIRLEIDRAVREFTVQTRWDVMGKYIATHSVNYIVLDSDHDAVSEHMELWHGLPGGKARPRIESRWPADLRGRPGELEPAMEVVRRISRVGEFEDLVNEERQILERKEIFRLPTLQRFRFDDDRMLQADRLPGPELAFVVDS